MYKFTAIILMLLVFSFSSVFAQVAEPALLDKGGNVIAEQPLLKPWQKSRSLQQSLGKAALNEGFESGVIPLNWTILNSDGGSYQWEAYSSTTYSHSGTYCARIRYESSTLDNDDWLITPPLDVQAGVNDTLRFWLRTYSNSFADPLEVKLSTTGTDTADFTVSLFDTTGYMGTYMEIVVPLDAYDGNIVYVGIRYTGAFDWYVYVDDFTGPEVYVPPVPIFIADASEIDFNLLNSLVPVGEAVSEYVRITNAGGGDLNINAVNTSSEAITTDFAKKAIVIPPGATDSVLVTWTPSVVDMDTGWVEFVHVAASSPDTVDLTLHSVDLGSWVVDFEADVSTWLLAGGYGFSINSTLGYTQINQHWGIQAYWKSGTTGRDTTFLWSPRLDLTGGPFGGPTKVGFYHKGSSTVNDDSIEVLVSQDGGATYTRIGLLTNNVTTHEYVSFDLSQWAGSDSVWIGWHYYYPAGLTSGGSWYMDDLALPKRYIPADGTLQASADSIDFGTVNVGDTFTYGVLLSNVGTATITINSITSDNADFLVSDIPTTLTSFQTDTFYISFAPTADGFSSGAVSIDHDGVNGKTILNIGVSGTGFDATIRSFPWTESFENSGSIPLGWVNDDLDSGKDWVFGTSAGHGAGADHTTGSGYFAYVDDSSPEYTDATNLISPPMDLTGVNTPTLSFWYWSNPDGGTADPGYMKIDIYDGSVWHLMVDSIGAEASEWREKIIDLSSYASAETKVRFSVFETTSFYHDIGIDDVSVTGLELNPNPPQNLMAVAGADYVDLMWDAPLPEGVAEIGYDNGSEQGFGFAAGGTFAVRFTPNVYPSTLLAMRVWWHSGEETNDVQYGVWEDQNGLDLGPVTQLLANTPYTVQNRNVFEEIDISGSGITINSGDFYYTFVQTDTNNYALGFDTDGPNASRAWLTFDGATWNKLEAFGFPYNFVVRALVFEGGSPKVVELKPSSIEPVSTMGIAEIKALRAKNMDKFQFGPQGNVANNAVAHGLNTFGYHSLRTEGIAAAEILGYNVYRSDDGVSFSSYAATDSNVTSFSDTSVTGNVTYWYYVTALYSGGESNPSDTVMALPGVQEDIYDHITPEIHTAATNEGTVGMLNVNGILPGFQWNGTNQLYEGALMFGVAPDQVVDAARVISGGAQSALDEDLQYLDFINVLDDNADSTVLATSFDDSRVTQAPLADDGPNAPIGLVINQTTYSYTDTANSGYVIYKLDITNASGTQVDGLFAGTYFDWDVNSFATNSGAVEFHSVQIPGVNSGNPFNAEFAYIYDVGAPNAYMGSVPLSQNFFRASRIADNAQEVFPGGASPLTEANKYNYMMDRRANDPYGDPFGPQDKSLVFGLGGGVGGPGTIPGSGFSIPVDATVTVGFAIVGGNDVNDFVTNGKAAMKKWIELGNAMTIFENVVSGIDDEIITAIPTKYELHQNYPNPFNPVTTIKYDLKKQTDVTLKIYDLLGQEIKTIVNEKQEAGYKSVIWDGTSNAGTSVATGIYIYKIETDEFVKSRKMIFMK